MSSTNDSNFYYSALNYIEINFLVEVHLLEKYFAEVSLKPLLLNGKGVLMINYHDYYSTFNKDIGFTQEIEVGIYCVPKSKNNQITGDEGIEILDNVEKISSYNIGIYRIHVPCNDDIAIEAGITKFGEPKYKMDFNTSLPSFNGDLDNRWLIDCKEVSSATDSVLSFQVNLTEVNSKRSFLSSRLYYGEKNNDLIGSWWNLFDFIESYYLDEYCNCWEVQFGRSNHYFKEEMKELIENNKPFLIRTYISSPVAKQSTSFKI